MLDFHSCKACGTPCPLADQWCSFACYIADNPGADDEPEFDVDWNDDSH